MYEFKLKPNANGNVDYIYSVGSDRYGNAEMPLAMATAFCSKANAEGKLSKSTECIADGYNIKVDDNGIKYFFGNVVVKQTTEKKSTKAKN